MMDNASLIPAEVTIPQTKHLRDSRTFQGIPSVIQTPSGRLFCCWYSGGADEGPENFIIVAYSDDHGESWSDAVAVIEPEDKFTRAFDPAIFITPSGRLFLFWGQSYSPENRKVIDNRCGVFFTELLNHDQPAADWKWSKSKRIADGLMLNKPTVLKNNSIALPIYVCRKNLVGVEEDISISGTKMYVSEDEFRTFREVGKSLMPLEEADFDEHSIIEKEDGSLWMIIRSRNGNHETFSFDGGKTWTEPVKSAITGPCARLRIFRLKSGRLLLINHLVSADPEKYSHARKDLAAMLSDDDGRTWYGNLMLDARSGVSYPDGMEGNDGFIYIVHDHERYLQGEVLLSRFTEDDVKAGKLVSPGSRLQMLISNTRGTGEAGANVKIN